MKIKKNHIKTKNKVHRVAKLVTISLMTRVVVPYNATDEEIMEQTKKQFIQQINSELFDNVISIKKDKEIPFVPFYDNTNSVKVYKNNLTQDEKLFPVNFNSDNGNYYASENEHCVYKLQPCTYGDNFDIELVEYENEKGETENTSTWTIVNTWKINEFIYKNNL